jgi:Pyruvate/2-oxoacid:ferredoxin oxidoreductase delta subunit
VPARLPGGSHHGGQATGAKIVNETTCVGCKVCTISCPFGTINYVQETGKVQKCDLCGGDPACATACPTGAITYVDANWTGLNKMKAWADKLGNQPSAAKENTHVLGRKNPPRQPHRRHRQVGTPQHGLGSRLPGLARPGDQVPGRRDRPQVDPLSEANKIIWATGPLTGTMASTGGRYTVVTKGPLTGAIACSNSGGYWGAELKMAGWDMVIFEGQVGQAGVPATSRTTWPNCATPRTCGARACGRPRRGAQEAPGPAAARVQHRPGGREPRAVRRRGERPAPRRRPLRRGRRDGQQEPQGHGRARHQGRGQCADPKEFMQVTFEKKKILHDNAVTGQGLPTYGTQVLMNVINEIGALPTRNHRDVQFEGAKDISAEAMATPRKTDGKKHLVTNQACFGCTIACGRISKMDQGHFTVQNKPQYWGASGGLEYEAAWALGAANGVNDLEALQYANLLCNEQGMDPISFGATIGAVMELYDMGVLTEGAAGHRRQVRQRQALAYFAEITAKGEGFGKEIGQGSAAPVQEVRPPRAEHERSRARSSRPTTAAASRAWAWPTPPATAAPATCAATPWPPKCWASR